MPLIILSLHHLWVQNKIVRIVQYGTVPYERMDSGWENMKKVESFAKIRHVLVLCYTLDVTSRIFSVPVILVIS